MLPRCVLVERSTEYRDLLARHGTREQARFFLEERGLAIEEVEDRHHAQQAHRTAVLAAVPPDWRTATVIATSSTASSSGPTTWRSCWVRTASSPTSRSTSRASRSSA